MMLKCSLKVEVCSAHKDIVLPLTVHFIRCRELFYSVECRLLHHFHDALEVLLVLYDA